MLRVFCFVILVLMSISPVLAEPRVQFSPGYFGLHSHRPFQQTFWDESGVGSIRLHDTNVTWLDLQPSPNNWKWDRLDRIVELAGSHGMNILLPLQATPSWSASSFNEKSAYGPGSNSFPRSVVSWRAYVEKVVERYRGRVETYEIWNEPNLKHFFSGTPEEMAVLTKSAIEVIRRVDPTARVVCPAPTGKYGLGWFDRFLSTGVASLCDVIGYHFYLNSETPESLPEYVRLVRGALGRHGLSGKPLWNTETGWLTAISQEVDAAAVGFDRSSRVLSDDEVSAYLQRMYLLSGYAGIERVYWYAWDNGAMGLTGKRGLVLGRASKVIKSFSGFFSGYTVESCSSKGGVWSCVMSNQLGQRVHAFWTMAGSASVTSLHAGELYGVDSSGVIAFNRSVGKGWVINVGVGPVYLKVE